MSATALNRALRRRRRRLTAFAVVFVLAGAVAAHHMPVDHVGMGGAMVMCLAVVPVVALAAAALAGCRLQRPWAVVALQWAPYQTSIPPPLPRARASPVATVALRL